MKISKMALHKCFSLRSKLSSLFSPTSIVLCFILSTLIGNSSGNIIRITRLPNQDDSFDVMSGQELICSSHTCLKYNASQKHSGISDSCLCQCTKGMATTFYTKTYTCMDSRDIIHENRCSIQFKNVFLGTLPVIDIVGSPGVNLRLTNKMATEGCSKLKTSWLYLKNGTWLQGKDGIFSVTLKQHWTKPNLNKWFLKWYSGLHNNYTGIIIKVVVTCERDGILENNEQGCLMFKIQGTYKVKQANITPTNKPQSSTAPKPSQTTTKTESNTNYFQPTQTTTTEHQVTSKFIILPTPTSTSNNPRKETATSGDQRIWIAFAAGGVTILFVLIAALVFFFLMCRQKKKQMSRTERHSSSRTENANDILHDYEYVVYPVLTEGYQSSSASIDNAMYGRGPDNELIIRTPGISMESLATNSINHSRNTGNHENRKSASAYYSRETLPINHSASMSNTFRNSGHEYAQLQRQMEDASDCSGIYQPLIRPVTPESIINIIDDDQAIPVAQMDTNTKTTGPDYMVLESTGPSIENINA